MLKRLVWLLSLTISRFSNPLSFIMLFKFVFFLIFFIFLMFLLDFREKHGHGSLSVAPSILYRVSIFWLTFVVLSAFQFSSTNGCPPRFIVPPALFDASRHTQSKHSGIMLRWDGRKGSNRIETVNFIFLSLSVWQRKLSFVFNSTQAVEGIGTDGQKSLSWSFKNARTRPRWPTEKGTRTPPWKQMKERNWSDDYRFDPLPATIICSVVQWSAKIQHQR